MSEHPQSSIQEAIQSRIRAGELKPRARGVFVLHMASVVLSALLALVVTLITLSFVFYSVYESGEAFLLGFGWEGVLLFFLLFPWFLAALALLSLALFQWRLSYLVPSYRLPILPVFLALILGTVGLGLVLAPVHSVVLERIENAELPILGELYEGVYESREGYGIYRGTVVSEESGGVWIRRSDNDADEDDGPRFVLVPQGSKEFRNGDELFVFGEIEGERIRARYVVAFPNSGE